MLPLTAIALALAALSPAVAAAGAPAASVDSMVEKRVPLRTHSIAPPYVDTDLQNRWWDFGGDAIINTNKHIRLTQDRQSEAGWLWSRMPLGVTNWQIDFEFKVDGKAQSMYGDGFAFWVTKDRAVAGPVFGSQDYFNGLGIFFDTYSNSRHSYTFPRITAMMGDGKTQYDLAGDNAKTEVGACSENFRRRDVATKARITYVKNHGLQLQLHHKEWDQWMTCFEINVNLPDSPYVGFSAATGDVSDNHDIISVQTFSATLYPQYRATAHQAGQVPLGIPDDKRAGPRGQAARDNARKRQDGSSSGGGIVGWFLFLLKAIGVLAFIAFGVAAYRTWAAQQRARPAYY
ncbi:uncharacterized protein EHS24_000293 [Apiotrichum porosum]|uniref:L-type lectin-like domain-containing protein n=1 Tax=Apiotrichum porosum TaxID=105984 RepID=A0A427YA02_9TREE|nr:uncharacterized protein EHS24_000293 [Apiotrichum porosum]RSH87777.1 hypothetical protein EHS24_000293 [Apiotrichum porosum]